MGDAEGCKRGGGGGGLTNGPRDGSNVTASNDHPSHRHSGAYVCQVVSDVGQHKLVVCLHQKLCLSMVETKQQCQVFSKARAC